MAIRNGLTTQIEMSTLTLEEKMAPHPQESERLSSRLAEPCVLVIFGATGDLTARKLLPALYNLVFDGQLSSHFACVGFARRDKSDEVFRSEMKEALGQFSRNPLDENIWNTFSSQIFYHQSNFDEEDGYESLKKNLEELDRKMGTKGNRLFYLATQPTYFPQIIERLKRHGLIYDINREKEKWSRVIIEKPFGHDYNSALELQQFILNHLAESQIFRIDHYLGKETVQNLLVFRFANSIFESFWNNQYVDHVQITMAEEIGIGTRGAFFEGEGVVRDIIQNHVMQLLTLVAMEPPISLYADAVRDEKVKVLQALRPVDLGNLDRFAVRGQYGPGFVRGEPTAGYRQKKGSTQIRVSRLMLPLRSSSTTGAGQGCPSICGQVKGS